MHALFRAIFCFSFLIFLLLGASMDSYANEQSSVVLDVTLKLTNEEEGGVLSVVEVLAVPDFSPDMTLQRRINIPKQNLSNIDVSSGVESVPFYFAVEDGITVLYIGDDIENSKNTIQLSYTVQNAVESGVDYDTFRWAIAESDWSVPVQDIRMRLDTDAPTAPEKSPVCLVAGNIDNCTTEGTNRIFDFVALKQLQLDETMEAEYYFPPDYLRPMVSANDDTVLYLGVGLAIGASTALYLRRKKPKNKQHDKQIPESH